MARLSPGERSSVVQCAEHGNMTAAFVCHHLSDQLHEEQFSPIGFHEPGQQEDEPQAWCGQCDKIMMREGLERRVRELCEHQAHLLKLLSENSLNAIRIGRTRVASTVVCCVAQSVEARRSELGSGADRLTNL